MHSNGGSVEAPIEWFDQKRDSSASDMESDVARITEQIKSLYQEDDLPWVVGYSGGKDSTATLQLVWAAIRSLPPEKRTKPVHVISTDTLVENPVVASWVEVSLNTMKLAALAQDLPIIKPHRLTPKLADRFWVNLIGKGYPAPRPKFRWCTSRLKISASNSFIREVADEHGEAILVLGSRSQESAARKRVIENYQGSTRELLSRNSDTKLDRVWVYTPISHWSNDDVWEFLVTHENPWGYSNQDLFTMYRGATPDAECPLVVDTSTPSCGDSRFGCFVCTLVDKDKSMEAMIQNDDEKRWMAPLSEFRNRYLDIKEDWDKRDFRRINGTFTLQQLADGSHRLVHGPYKQDYRETLLEALLRAQSQVRALAIEAGRAELSTFELIGLDELEEIRRIWVSEKHEIEDSLPLIYERVLDVPYPGAERDENLIFSADDVALLKQVAASDADKDNLHFQLLRELIHVEQGYRTATRRAGIYEALESALERGAFESEEEATAYVLARKRLTDEASEEREAGGSQAQSNLQFAIDEEAP